MPYIGQSLTEGTRREYTYVATASQTTFNAIYTVGAVDVYQNGVLLAPSDYTATTGTTVVFNTGAALNDEITIHCHNTFSVADTYTKSASDDRFVNASGDTMTGTLMLPDDTAMIRRASNAEWVMGFDATNNILSIGTQGGTTANRLQLCSGGNKIAIEADGAGRVTMPYQPAFEAGISSTTAYTSGLITWTSTYLNTGNHFNGSSFTAPVSGLYFFCIDWLTFLNTSATDVSIYLNGSPKKHSRMDSLNSSSNHRSASCTSIISLSAGDYVDARLGTYSANPLYGDPNAWTRFSGYLIG